MHRGAAGEDFGEIDLTPLIICKEVPSPEGRISVQIPYSQLLMQSQCLALGARPVSPTIWFDAPINLLWSQQKKTGNEDCGQSRQRRESAFKPFMKF